MAAKRPPVLDHLVNMTDDVGMFQHARFDVPLRSAGYCTDDIGRALIVSVEAARNRATETIGDKLSTIYLSYLQDAQLADGWFHNFMGYDRQWQDVRGGEDTFGRALWGLGYAMLRAPRDSWRVVARTIVDSALPHVETLSYLRARAYAALGLAPVIAAAAPDADAARTALRSAVEPIVVAYEAHRAPDWSWCEDTMTYDNARIPEACLRAGDVLGDHRYMRAGLEMLDFYASIVVENGMFVPIGNNGWYRRGGPRARYGQQPLEASAFVDANEFAYGLTSNARYRQNAEIGYDWFFGRNTQRFLMVTDGGCRDGIDEHGVNPNMGAESTLAYLLSALTLAERPGQQLRAAR